MQIDYLIDHPEFIPQLAEWLFEEWGTMLGETNLDTRIKRLYAHMNRDELPIAWVAHSGGELFGTASLRVHDLEGRHDLTPWLGGVYVGSKFRHQGIGEKLCAAVENAARGRGVETLYLFTLDRQAWYSRRGWTVIDSCVWCQRAGEIMSKRL